MGEGLQRIMGDKIVRAAQFPHPDFRRSLYRSWTPTAKMLCHSIDGKPVGAFIGLNSGKADDKKDDATARKYMGFGRRWGWGSYWAFNLFEYVTTHPRDLAWRVEEGEPINYDGTALEEVLPYLDVVCLAWGNPPAVAGLGLRRMWQSEVDKTMALLKDAIRPPQIVVCAALTVDGHPAHLSRLGYVPESLEISLDPLHPFGRCICRGTGKYKKCAWCRQYKEA